MSIVNHACFLLDVLQNQGVSARVGPAQDEVTLHEGGPNTIIYCGGSDSAAEWADNIGAVTGSAGSIHAAADEIYNFLRGDQKKRVIVMGYSRGALIAQCLASKLGDYCDLLVTAASPGCNDSLVSNRHNLNEVPKVIINRSDDIIRGVSASVGHLEDYVTGNILANFMFNGDDWNGIRAHMNLMDEVVPQHSQRNDSTVPRRTLQLGEILWTGESLKVGNKELAMQGDGNLVLYINGQPRWHMNLRGANHILVNQGGDGHLFVTNQVGGYASVCYNGQCRLVLQNDGNLVMYRMDSGNPVWATGTN